MLTMLGLTSVSMTFLAGHSLMQAELEKQPKHIEILYRNLEDEEDDELETVPPGYMSAGLRGNLMHDVVVKMGQEAPRTASSPEKPKEKDRHHHEKKAKAKRGTVRKVETQTVSGVAVPTTRLPGTKALSEDQDQRFYPENATPSEESKRRVVALEGSPPPAHYDIDTYPAVFSDNTQYYSTLDSSDERLSTMELREPLDDGECVPMQEWQTTFHPSCNGMHEMDLAALGEEDGDYFDLFGTKGYWRNAWRVDVKGGHLEGGQDTIVLKTLK